jgi:SSS family solute:Na+ symporter
MSPPLLMLLIYFIITTGISVYFANKNKNSSQYFVAGRSLTTSLVVVVLFSEIIAGAGTIGNAANAYRSGISSVWANWGMAIGCMTFILLVSKFYRAMALVKGSMSVPEVYGQFFDRRSRVVVLINVVIVYFIIYSTQAIAASAILSPLLHIDQSVMVFFITIHFILLTFFGGRKGIANMNFIHSLVMYIGMAIVAFKSLRHVGGIEVLSSSLPPSFFSFARPNFFTVLAQLIGAGVSSWASANMASAVFSGKSLSSVNRGMCIAGLLIVPFALMPAFIGMCAKIALPDINAQDSLFMFADSLGGIFSGLISMSIVAAIWSSAPSLLLVISMTITKDLYKGFLRPFATDQQQMLVSRIVVIILGIAGSIFGLNAGSILDQMLGAFQIRSIVGIVLVAALYWPRVTKDAAFYSMLIGGSIAAIWHFSDNPFGVAPLWPSVFISLLILIPMSLCGKERVSEGYRMYREAISLMEGRKDKKRLLEGSGEAEEIRAKDSCRAPVK